MMMIFYVLYLRHNLGKVSGPKGGREGERERGGREGRSYIILCTYTCTCTCDVVSEL